jgi:hypothetical protein
MGVAGQRHRGSPQLCGPGSDREPDLAGPGCWGEAKPLRCEVELGLFDVRRRPGLGRGDGRDVVTALPDLVPDPRRRRAAGIAR